MALRNDHVDWQLKAACRGPQSAVFFPPSRPERREESAAFILWTVFSESVRRARSECSGWI